MYRMTTISIIAALGTASLALAHDGDIGIRTGPSGLETVLVNGEPPAQVFGTEIERVFGIEFAFNPTTNDVRIDEPGFASNDPNVLGQTLTFRIRSAARAWNGSTFVPTTTTLSTGLPDLGIPFVPTPATDSIVPVSNWIATDDFHFDWKLDGATSSTGNGIFLVEIDVTSPTLGSTPPFWLVFNYGLTETEHDAAIDWTVDNLVPAPATAGLLIGVGSLAARRRRPQ